jgi:putative two-component system response regulator
VNNRSRETRVIHHPGEGLFNDLRLELDALLYSHESQTGLLVQILAQSLRRADVDPASYRSASQVHDVGKFCISHQIMRKKAALTADEIGEIRKHPEYGAQFLMRAGYANDSLSVQAALTHHERYDGTGYPHGLVGTKIPLIGRLVTLADTYDALRSPRPYKEPVSHQKAMSIIADGDGRTLPSHFDPELLAVMLANENIVCTTWESMDVLNANAVIPTRIAKAV